MDNFKFKKHLAYAVLAIAAGAVVACGGGGGVGVGVGVGVGGGGGGGGGGDTPSAPTLSLTPQSTRIFHFSWTPVSGATRYVLLEDADGGSGYQPVSSDDIPAGASVYDHEVFLPARINARYVLQACNASGCADSAAVAVSGNLAAATGYVKASVAWRDSAFGLSVALSRDGQTMAVGNLRQTVHVYARAGGIWVMQAQVQPSVYKLDDEFGHALALSGDGTVLAVSAKFEDSNSTGTTGDPDNDAASDSGAAYVFRRTGNAWAQEAYLKASNTGAEDHFGESLALSADGTTLAVGAIDEDSSATTINGEQNDNSAMGRGAVYVFTHDGSAWTQQAYVKAATAGTSVFFGQALALSANGNTLAVGADRDNGRGATYVFTRDNDNWTQQAHLQASNATANDRFGTSVALSANGDTLAVSAFGKAGSTGAAYVFTRSGNDWAEQAYLQASNAQATDGFGSSIALSPEGHVLAVGAASEDSGAVGINGNQADESLASSGAVYVFARSGSHWAQQAYVKAPNTDAGDFFGGVGLALGGEGRSLTMAVGAIQEDSGTSGINGNQADDSVANSGAVYLY